MLSGSSGPDQTWGLHNRGIPHSAYVAYLSLIYQYINTYISLMPLLNDHLWCATMGHIPNIFIQTGPIIRNFKDFQHPNTLKIQNIQKHTKLGVVNAIKI